MRAAAKKHVPQGEAPRVPPTVTIDARGFHHKDLNRRIRALALEGHNRFEVLNVFGQRFFGTNLWGIGNRRDIRIVVHGTPGSDLGAFMDGPFIQVKGNVQDATGNTMNAGLIVVHGNAGDVLGYGMRGGEIYVRGNVGYRVGIHMKEYRDLIPTIVIGGTTQDFFGEYMAGGRIIVLNRFIQEIPESRQSYFIGTGMHGGSIFIRGEVHPDRMGAEVGVEEPGKEESRLIRHFVDRYCRHFNIGEAEARILREDRFCKLYAKSGRPYGKLYAY